MPQACLHNNFLHPHQWMFCHGEELESLEGKYCSATHNEKVLKAHKQIGIMRHEFTATKSSFRGKSGKTWTKDNFLNSDSTLFPIASVDACRRKFHEHFLFDNWNEKVFQTFIAKKVFSPLWNCNNTAIYLSSCKGMCCDSWKLITCQCTQ